MDWDLGHYEYVAAQLFPAAEAVVDYLEPRPRERVVDLGCGTGNAALLVGARGAVVTGVDPSPRLLEVARASALGQTRDIHFYLGRADSIPTPDCSLDAIVSVFGVIFASDAQTAAVEMARTLNPTGRIVFSAWLPGGVLAEQARIRREAVASVQGVAAGSAPFAWHDVESLEVLLHPLGFVLETQEASLEFRAPSLPDFLEGEIQNHPLWVEARAILEPLGRWTTVREEVRRVFEEANEDPESFCVTSRFVMVKAARTDTVSSITSEKVE